MELISKLRNIKTVEMKNVSIVIILMIKSNKIHDLIFL